MKKTMKIGILALLLTSCKNYDALADNNVNIKNATYGVVYCNRAKYNLCEGCQEWHSADLKNALTIDFEAITETHFHYCVTYLR